MNLTQRVPLFLSLLWLGTGWLVAQEMVENESLALRHLQGFVVQQVAHDEQVHGLRTIALDQQGKLYASGRGWIRRLEDTDKDGRADTVTEFARTTTGASGMVFVGNDLYALVDGYFCRFLDSDADGVADGPPQRFFEFGVGPMGAHSLRRGPGGSWYVLAGPAAQLDRQHWNHAGSPVQWPEGGALIHISQDLSRSEVLAEGFFNPVDFDFHATGSIFTADGTWMADEFMPWHAAPRLQHVAVTGNHGWRQRGMDRPWAAPDYYPDQVSASWNLGGRVGAGVEFYSHHQFPPVFRGGAFVCDWENGHVLHVQPTIFQSSFAPRVNLFVASADDSGFTPVDLTVEPDGSVLVASGGRGVSGAIYRVRYAELDPATGRLPDQPPAYLSDLDHVLRPPQRDAAWSRADWLPLAFRQGRGPFEEVAKSLNDPESYKLIAIDVLTELFGGLGYSVGYMTMRSHFESVRARTAWAIARYPYDGCVDALNGLAEDNSMFVRRAALEAARQLGGAIPPNDQLRMSRSGLGMEDQRVRNASIALAARLPEVQWRLLTNEVGSMKSLDRLSVAMAAIDRNGSERINDFAIDQALVVLGDPEQGTPLLGLMAVRVIMQSLGDWNLSSATTEAFAPFGLSRVPAVNEGHAARILNTIRPLFPTGGAPLLDAELARLLGMLGDTNPEAAVRVMTAFSQPSPATSDIHYLAVLAQLNPTPAPPALTQAAQVLLWLDDKAGSTRRLPVQEWHPRVLEIAGRLLQKNPAIAEALVAADAFPRSEHAYLIAALPDAQKERGRRRFAEAIRSSPNVDWTPTLIRELAPGEGEELRERIRGAWGDPALNDAIVVALAGEPQQVDHYRFTVGLGSLNPETVLAAAQALLQLEEPAPERLVGPVMGAFYRSLAREDDRELRKALIAWLRKHVALPMEPYESETDTRSLELIYEPVIAWFEQNHHAAAVALSGMTAERFDLWRDQMSSVPWARGRVAAGEALFQEKHCANCHGGGTGFGPDLIGVAERHTPTALIRSILFPQLQVAPEHALWRFTTLGGKTHVGVPVFESAQTVILQTEEGETVRLRQTDIGRRVQTGETLMPLGLLKRSNARDLADLYAYLQSLN